MMIPSQSYCFSGVVTLYFFLLVSLVLHTLASPMLHFCRHDQRDALLEFKHEFPSLSSWNTIGDCCFWRGVTCDAKSGEVISLDLSDITLSNSLKADSGLFKLQHLRELSLIDCGLYGEIPSSLGNLSHLTHLEIFDNFLVGEVPASFANLTKLSYLDISGNQFTGKNFPLILVNLTSLSFLRISHNQFESTLPPDMSGFHNLEEFNVGGNSFSGPFPTSLFMIPSLTYVSLWINQFKGPIEFSNISSSSKLQSLDLYQNKFDGPIPKSISKFPNLGYLVLRGNNFTGSIPTSISKLVNLDTLDLSHNNFTRSIPTSISKLVKLKYLDLSNNKLKGEIPGCLGGLMRELYLSRNSFSGFAKSFEVSDLTQIQKLDLSSNSFRGPLPYWICKLRSLMFRILDLSSNSFSGSIPQCLKNTVVALRVLNLRNNNFSGILLPEIFVNATQLFLVDVSGNQLEGKLPKSLINCTSLQILNVKGNRIKDKFPSWLSSLPSLHVLILRSNKFYGPLYHPHVSIGFQSVKVIDISHNDFTGTLPPFYFSHWREMTTLSEQVGGMYMVDPYYRHQISMEMVNKGVDTEFELIRKDFIAIDFSGNNFVGGIPKSIGLLKELRLLNLSGNAFTSNIPQSLENLTKLEELDLSRNQLSGQIPRDLGSLSFLSTMNFSHNNLEGPIPRDTQFQRQNCSVFMDNPRLYGLEDICGETHVPNPTAQEPEDLSEPEEQVISWIAAAIAYGPGVFCGLVIGHIFSPHKHEWLMAMFRRNKPRSAR